MEYLPNLPNFRSSGSVMKTGQKKQMFDFVNGQIFMKDDALPPVVNATLNGSVDLMDRSVLSIGTQTSLLNAQKKAKGDIFKNVNVILTYQAYFLENVKLFEDYSEEILRKCTIFFYVEKGEMMIIEKPMLNSGIPQAKLVKKSVVYKADGTPFTIHDLHVGDEITVNNRKYILVDADPATRKYLKKFTGVTEAPELPVPFDKYAETRKRFDKSLQADGDYRSKKNPNKIWMEVMKGNYVDNNGREGFMRYGATKLKFKCVWDNTDMLYGDRQEFSFQYHLCDDTVEIFSIAAPNSGRDSTFSRLLKKSKLPKQLTAMTLEPSETKPQYYHWTDIFIGLEMDVYARKLRFVDADVKTRQFYAQHGIPLDDAELPPEPVVVVYEREIPPHMGIGSEEDTLRSCNGPLLPGPVPAKKLGENKMLSYFASLLSGGPNDTNRRFVITFYVQDNTVKITEPPIRNSGFVGGVFLSRRSIKHESGEPLTYHHFFVGCKIRILKHRFLLLDSNDSTLKWMEDHNLPKASFYTIVDKLRLYLASDAVDGTLSKLFEAQEEVKGSGRVDINGFRNVLNRYKLMGDSEDQISEHELITIIRGNGNKLPTFNYTKLVEQIIQPTDEFK